MQAGSSSSCSQIWAPNERINDTCMPSWGREGAMVWITERRVFHHDSYTSASSSSPHETPPHRRSVAVGSRTQQVASSTHSSHMPLVRSTCGPPWQQRCVCGCEALLI